MPRIKCKQCGEIFLAHVPGTDTCPDCYVINKKIRDGKMCPQCKAEPYEVADTLTFLECCRACGHFTHSVKCSNCKKEILFRQEWHFINDAGLCTECHTEKMKPPVPETMEEKFDRLIVVMGDIAKSFKIVTDSIELEQEIKKSNV